MALVGDEVKPPVESYVRATYTTGSIELIMGVQFTDPAEYFDLLAASHALMREAVASLEGSHTVASPPMLAWAVRERIEAKWPGRYWFCETCNTEERDGWCQVYSPRSRRWSLVEEFE